MINRVDNILTKSFVVLILITLISGSISQIPAQRLTDPTQTERDFFNKVKNEFTNNPNYGKPANANDPRIDVTQMISLLDNKQLIASKDCPQNSPVKKVEIYATLRLAHWNPSKADLSGEFGDKSYSREIKDGVKKLEYEYYVMLDSSKDSNDKIDKWSNVATFYHEMMHGQIKLNKIKDLNWSGWDTACKCGVPNPGFVGTGVDSEAHEHISVNPAEDRFLIDIIRDKENVTGSTFTTTGITGDKDADGNRPFHKEITLPDNILEKEEISWKTLANSSITDITVTIDRNAGKAIIDGKVRDDKTGNVLIFIDPQNTAFFVRLLLPSHVIPMQEPEALDQEPIQIWMWAIPVIIAAAAAIGIIWKIRKH